mmetsp:Transcript_44985/g.112695  ORF Transcript_44985/g.112695 Transcript_44985/m.112695 type:complete len:214 (+) Transcript_44985:541-1182(+)
MGGAAVGLVGGRAGDHDRREQVGLQAQHEAVCGPRVCDQARARQARPPVGGGEGEAPGRRVPEELPGGDGEAGAGERPARAHGRRRRRWPRPHGRRLRAHGRAARRARRPARPHDGARQPHGRPRYDGPHGRPWHDGPHGRRHDGPHGRHAGACAGRRPVGPLHHGTGPRGHGAHDGADGRHDGRHGHARRPGAGRLPGPRRASQQPRRARLR